MYATEEIQVEAAGTEQSEPPACIIIMKIFPLGFVSPHRNLALDVCLSRAKSRNKAIVFISPDYSCNEVLSCKTLSTLHVASLQAKQATLGKQF